MNVAKLQRRCLFINNEILKKSKNETKTNFNNQYDNNLNNDFVSNNYNNTNQNKVNHNGSSLYLNPKNVRAKIA